HPGRHRFPQGQGARVGAAQAAQDFPAQRPGRAGGQAAARRVGRRPAHGAPGREPGPGGSVTVCPHRDFRLRCGVIRVQSPDRSLMFRRLRQLLAALAASLLLCGQVAAGEPGVLVLGRISDDPAAHYDQLKPLLDYVVPRMRDVGIREGRVLMARDARQMESYMRRGRVDWVTETSASAMILQARARARPPLLTERSGVEAYHTVFIARRDSGINSLADLRGRSIAFQNPTSTSAYFVPAMELIALGLPMEILLSPFDRPVEGSVGYLFARSEFNISTWVHKGLVDAGAFSNQDWESMLRMPESYRRDLVAFHATDEYPRGLEMVRGDLSPAVAQRLRVVLAGAANDPAASEALQRFFGTTRFLPIDGDTRRSLDVLSSGVARVAAVLE